MFCQICGREISDQAKFCNYCGAPVNAARQQTASKAHEVTPEKPKKKGKAGSTIVTILVALVVYFGVRAITENVLTNKNKPASTPRQSQGIIEVTGDVSAAMSSCMYGGLYQNGTLQYGMTKLTARGILFCLGKATSGTG